MKETTFPSLEELCIGNTAKFISIFRGVIRLHICRTLQPPNEGMSNKYVVTRQCWEVTINTNDIAIDCVIYQDMPAGEIAHLINEDNTRLIKEETINEYLAT